MESFKYILLPVVIFLSGSVSYGMWQKEPTLDELAYMMYDSPDSTIYVIQEVEPRFKVGAGDSDAHADSVANTVFNYYRRHGSRKAKLDMFYILGRFHQTRGNEEASMFCYVNAEEYVSDADTPAVPGCLYASMGTLYEYGYDYSKAADYYSRGGDCFLQAADFQHYAQVLIRSARCCFYMGDEDKARKILDRLDPYWNYVRGEDQVRYFRLILNMGKNVPLEDVIRAIGVVGSTWEDSLESGNLLAISDIYLKSGYADSAMVYLQRYATAEPDYDANATYYLRLSNLYDTLGQSRLALDAYRKHVALKDSTYLDKIDENVQLVDAMYDSYAQMYRSERIKRILWVSLAAVLVAGTVAALRFRKKIWTQTRRADYLEELYNNVLAEKETLTNIIRNSVMIDEPTRNVIQNRLVVLDELLTMRRLGDYSPQKATEMIESIALDQDAYMNSLGLMFSLRHPQMASYLRRRGLSAWETGYCSLYCMGYKGKDIGNILSSSRYYKINSEIRKKLEIGPMDTNLDIYLRQLMSKIEKDASDDAKNRQNA